MAAGVSLVLVLASYVLVFSFVVFELPNGQSVLTFVLPLFVAPFFVSIVTFYRDTALSTGVFIGITPAVAAAILLLLLSQSPDGIAGDGPIWLILLVVAILGLAVSGIGSAIGFLLRAIIR